eukprot:m.38246 g.38246  ORF g.38246 m.38246 type:complete len:537 (+) comp5629_c0_seq1:124-1734(+)
MPGDSEGAPAAAAGAQALFSEEDIQKLVKDLSERPSVAQKDPYFGTCCQCGKNVGLHRSHHIGHKCLLAVGHVGPSVKVDVDGYIDSESDCDESATWLLCSTCEGAQLDEVGMKICLQPSGVKLFNTGRYVVKNKGRWCPKRDYVHGQFMLDMRDQPTGSQALKVDEVNFFCFLFFRCWLKILHAEPGTPTAQDALELLKKHHPNGANGMSTLKVAVWVDTGADLVKKYDNLDAMFPGFKSSYQYVSDSKFEDAMAIMVRFWSCLMVSPWHIQIGHVHVFVLNDDIECLVENLKRDNMSTESPGPGMTNFLASSASDYKDFFLKDAGALLGGQDLQRGRGALTYFAELDTFLDECYIEGMQIKEPERKWARADEDEVRTAMRAVSAKFNIDNWRRETEDGNALSMAALAACYDLGFGTPLNSVKATELYEDAAEHGNVHVRRLFTEYSRGQTSADQDCAATSQRKEGWIPKRVRGGTPDIHEAPSQFYLAWMLFNDPGFIKYTTEARRLIKLVLDSENLEPKLGKAATELLASMNA